MKGLSSAARPTLGLLAVITVLLMVALAPAAGATAGSAGCTPGSGKDLSGRQLTSADVRAQQDLKCANLTGARLAGLDLVQVDLAGAILKNADLSKTRLIQATLDGADLTNANLSGSDLSQADMKGTVLTGADLSGADLTQVTATGAKFDQAKVGGADFTQATLDGASFTGAQGLKPWSLYLLIGAGAAFLLLAVAAVAKAVRRRRPTTAAAMWTAPGIADYGFPPAAPQVPRPGGFAPINPRAVRGVGHGLAFGLVGALLVAFGLHLFAGGLIGQFSFAFDTLATTVCTYPSCPVGISSGMIGLFGGILIAMVGFVAMARA